MTDKKRCMSCGERLPLDDFYRDRHCKKDGRKRKCRECELDQYASKPIRRNNELLRSWRLQNDSAKGIKEDPQPER